MTTADPASGTSSSPATGPDAVSAPLGPSPAPPVVIAAGLTKRYGPVVAVDALDLEIPRGEVFGLIGANGAGKTTTIKMLITLVPPSAGSARIADHDVTRESATVRRVIGYVPQLVSADGSLTGIENLRLSARLYHLPGREIERRIRDLLTFMGLGEAMHRLVRTYSGGMVRRLEIAQAMLHEPEVLFLDEPTVGLDPTARTAVWEHLDRLRAERGTTIIVTTHYLTEAEVLCDRVAIMHHGRIIALDTPVALAASVGPGATLDDVFRLLVGADIETGGGLRDVARARRTARRLG
ncbi:MAG TPA: ATP-binding cassette domain-containing protein [Candidatus Limnocylindrales bacterium]|nr:ATP-binding cassette domain-containing protein [Candidatus Limnocylindrales bacterium]